MLHPSCRFERLAEEVTSGQKFTPRHETPFDALASVRPVNEKACYRDEPGFLRVLYILEDATLLGRLGTAYAPNGPPSSLKHSALSGRPFSVGRARAQRQLQSALATQEPEMWGTPGKVRVCIKSNGTGRVGEGPTTRPGGRLTV